MRFYVHRLLRQVYVSIDQATPKWKHSLPNGGPAREQCVHLYARLAPEQGEPDRECGIVPIFEETFRGYFMEVSPSDARQIDPELVAHVNEIARHQQNLARLRYMLPITATLYLIDFGENTRGVLYDVYRKDCLFETRKSLGRFHEQSTPMLYLTEFLHWTGILPTCQLNGAPRVLIPFSPEAGWHSEKLLAQALMARIWGGESESTPYQFEVTYW